MNPGLYRIFGQDNFADESVLNYCGACSSAGRAGFANVDATIEIGELKFGAAAVNRAVDGFVDLHAVFATMAAAIFDGLLYRRGQHLNVEIGEDLPPFGLEAEVGFQIRRKCNVDVTVQ